MKRFLKFLDSLIYVSAAVFVAAILWLILPGCGTTANDTSAQDAATGIHVNQQISKLKKEISDRINERSESSSIPEKTSPSETMVQKQPASSPEKTIVKLPEKDIGKIILDYANWIYLAVLCVVSLIGGWYFKRTGKKSETLQKIEETVNQRLPWKQRIVFKIIKWIYRNRKKKGK